MRWNTLPPKEKQPYRKWFAWFPVKVANGEYVWLEFVERRLIYPFSFTRYGSFYAYRDIGSEDVDD